MAPASLQPPILPLSASLTLFQSHCHAVPHTGQTGLRTLSPSSFWLDHNPMIFALLILFYSDLYQTSPPQRGFLWPSLEHHLSGPWSLSLLLPYLIFLHSTFSIDMCVCLFIPLSVPPLQGHLVYIILFPPYIDHCLGKSRTSTNITHSPPLPTISKGHKELTRVVSRNYLSYS